MNTIKESWNQLSHNVKDLILWADNNLELNDKSKNTVMSALAKKFVKGEYKKDMARNAWGYHADRSAKNYHEVNGDRNIPWHKAWPVADRKAAATHWEEIHHDQLKESVQNNNLTETNDNYSKLLNSILEKKPLIVKEEFDKLIKEVIINIISEKKEQLKKFVFKEGKIKDQDQDGVGEGSADNSDDNDSDDQDGLTKPKKQKNNNVIHASIHPNDKTSQEND